MTPELQAEVENLVFSVPSPYLSLDNRLKPWLDLIAKIERAAERDAYERAVEVLTDMATEDRRLAASPHTYDDEAEERRAQAYRLDQATERIRSLMTNPPTNTPPAR